MKRETRANSLYYFGASQALRSNSARIHGTEGGLITPGIAERTSLAWLLAGASQVICQRSRRNLLTSFLGLKSLKLGDDVLKSHKVFTQKYQSARNAIVCFIAAIFPVKPRLTHDDSVLLIKLATMLTLCGLNN
jgi:hypothetical protein